MCAEAKEYDFARKSKEGERYDNRRSISENLSGGSGRVGTGSHCTAVLSDSDQPLEAESLDNVFGWIGKKVNGSTEKRLNEVEKQISNMWVNDHRQKILTFARECRADIAHSSDEWSNVLNVAEEYEHYVEEKHITNGIITQDTEYLRKLYQELSMGRKV